MLVTLTPNPSIDATVSLRNELEAGLVHRAESVTQVAGGKGINVARAAQLADWPSVAIFPSAQRDPFVTLIDDMGLDYIAEAIPGHIRVNTTVTEPGGRTTKLNGQGPHVSADAQQGLIDKLSTAVQDADWLVLAGSLPQAVPTDWYVTVIAALRTAAPKLKIAVDTSDAPMVALADGLSTAAPDLIKPNGMELGQLTGVDGLALESAAAQGDYSGVVEAGNKILAMGIPEVLVTLGSAGAVYIDTTGAWVAGPPPTAVQSTVGAGDAALAGFIMARSQSAEPADALLRAVAYGSAAAALPGTTMPTPLQLDLQNTTVSALS